MRTEAQLTADVLSRLRKLRPHWWIVKNNDRTTAGVPDALIVREDGLTRFIEFKRSPSEAPTIDKLLTRAQVETLNKLDALDARYYVIVRTPLAWRVYTMRGFVISLPPRGQDLADWLS